MTERELLQQALDALEDQKQAIADWGAYAGDYFKRKYNLDGDIAANDELIESISAHLAQPPAEPQKLWLWKNFVDGKPEYWAFDNPFPVHMDCGDPQTLGEPCGYAIVKPSRQGRTDVSDAEVLRRINAASQAPFYG